MRLDGWYVAVCCCPDDSLVVGMTPTPGTLDAATLFPIRLELPLPPRELSKNGRAHWATKATLYQQHKLIATWTLIANVGRDITPTDALVVMGVTWQGPKHHWPDADAVVERTACIRDALEAAGIIVNDKQIEQICVRFKVGERRCLVEFRLAAGDQARTEGAG
jgi:Holliday junction resolvase RusA-like endonuclease